MCVYACSCVCMHAHVCVGMLMCVSGEGSHGSSSFEIGSLTGLGLVPVGKASPMDAHLCFHRAGVTGMQHLAWELRPSCWQDKCLLTDSGSKECRSDWCAAPFCPYEPHGT